MPEGAAVGSAGRIPGESGIWVFIFGDMAMFALFFGTLIWFRGAQPDAYAAGQEHLHLAFGVTNTLLLLTSSLCVVRGIRAVHRLGAAGARAWFCLAGLCGIAFATIKALEYTDLVAGHHTPATNDFYMYFFVFTGIHAAHLLIGLGALTFMAWRTGAIRTRRHIRQIECGASYWHMVDLLWVVLFPLLYLLR